MQFPDEMTPQNQNQSNGLIARFYTEAIPDDRATNGWTEETFDIATGQHKTIRHPGAGRPIFKDADWIEIRIPGNIAEVRCREVRPSDKVRFPREWEAFKKGQSEPVIGTPLERLPFLSKSQTAELKAAGLRTAEDVRNISDIDAQGYMGMGTMKQRIIDFLAAAEGHAPMATMRSELETRDSEIAALKDQVAKLARLVDERAK